MGLPFLICIAVIAALFAWLLIPAKKQSSTVFQTVGLPAEIPLANSLPTIYTPEAAAMAEKLAVLQKYARQQQEAKQVASVVTEFKELFK